MLALFLVETKNKTHDSDYKYIKALIENRYDIGNAVKLDRVYLDGKGNYNQCSKKIEEKIQNYRKSGNEDDVIIFMCIDIDNPNKGVDPQANSELNTAIKNYCQRMTYELIWFYKDIEDVFLGKSVSKDKVKEADAFLRRKGISYVEISKLQSNTYSTKKSGKSNIVTVLDKYFARKR